jgi:hypothetical protein
MGNEYTYAVRVIVPDGMDIDAKELAKLIVEKLNKNWDNLTFSAWNVD